MEAQKPIYTGTLEDLDRLEIDSHIAEARSHICGYYLEGFLMARKAAEEANDQSMSSAFQLLYELVSFSPDFNDPAAPYRPRWSCGDKRSMLPEDISDDDYVVIRRMAAKTQDPSLRARLFDLLWLKEKNHEDCRSASECYTTSAKRLDNAEHEFSWLDACKEFHRGLQLGRVLGRDSNARINAVGALVAAIMRRVEEETTLRACHYLEVACENRVGDPVALAEVSEIIAERLKEKHDFDFALRYFELATEFWRFANQPDKKHRSQIEVGECHVSKATEAAASGREFFVAATFLKDGIEALRRAKADKARIKDLRVRLIEYQENSLDEMNPIEHSYDISEEVEKSRKFVAGDSFAEATKKFVSCIPLTNLDKLREVVLENIQNFPLQHLFGASMVDSKGRYRMRKKSFLNLDGKEAEKALEEEMIAHFAKFMMPHVVSCFVQPAREQITFDHQPDIYALIPLVRNNPFVPEHHEGIFLRGLHAGFHGDYLLSSVLLIPQIENSIRYSLESQGIETSNLMEDGTQPYKLLGALFDMPETRKIFSDSLCFELKALLIEKSGVEFRNRLAHGFVTEGECYDRPAIYLWWLVLRICLTPILRQIHN
ncbi:MAG: DUF4209 domain-containing protein [Opitutales bacterium]|nr:DUF4209 domain-containing protein [Opitutales bacterium]